MGEVCKEYCGTRKTTQRSLYTEEITHQILNTKGVLQLASCRLGSMTAVLAGSRSRKKAAAQTIPSTAGKERGLRRISPEETYCYQQNGLPETHHLRLLFQVAGIRVGCHAEEGSSSTRNVSFTKTARFHFILMTFSSFTKQTANKRTIQPTVNLPTLS